MHVVTRSRTAQARQSASQIVASPADTTPTSSVADQPTSVERDDDVSDLSPLFDEAAAQPPLSIDSVDRRPSRINPSAAGRHRFEESV